MEEFQRLLALLHIHCEQVNRPDTLRWKLGNNCVFSVKSFYENLLAREKEVLPIKSVWIP